MNKTAGSPSKGMETPCLGRRVSTVSLRVARHDPLAAHAAETQALLRALRTGAPES
jgi:hypothetical protein